MLLLAVNNELWCQWNCESHGYVLELYSDVNTKKYDSPPPRPECYKKIDRFCWKSPEKRLCVSLIN